MKLNAREALRALHEEMAPGKQLASVDRSVAALLPSNVGKEAGDKIVKDNIWGVITLPRFLVPLVDTRLLQRQRGIRQLGLSYLTYPTAGYGRFEHALGANHVMRMLLDSLRTSLNAEDVLVEKHKRALQIATLLHDIGHMPFSHASERALTELEERFTFGDVPVVDVQRRLANGIGKKLKLAEIITVLVLLAPSLHAYAGYLREDPADVEDMFLCAAAYSVGVPTDAEDVFCAQMLSGPLDVDRLDYMARDSRVCGIPIAVDVQRLVVRCRVVKVSPEKLPEPRRTAARERFGEQETRQFVTDLSGANALEEMAMSRMVLYDRVYHHQKTRCAEAVLAELLNLTLEEGLLHTNILDFWSQTDEGFLHRCAASTNATIREHAERLLYRRLPRRALAFGHRLIEQPIVPEKDTSRERRRTVDEAVRRLMESIDDAFTDRDQRSDLRAAIVDEATRLASGTPQEPITPLTTVLFARRPSSPLSSIGDALVLGPGERIQDFSVHMPLEQWGDAFMINKSVGFVYCDSEWREWVHIAAERVLSQRFVGTFEQIEARFRNTDAGMVQAKLDESKVNALRVTCDERGNLGHLRGPRPLRVSTESARQVADRLRDYQGVGDWHVTPEHVGAFIRQFPCVHQLSVVEDILKRLEVINRGVGVGTLTKSIKEYLGKSASITVVGLSPNSGELWRTLVEQELKPLYGDRIAFHVDGDVAAAEPTRELLLIDDLFASGSQASCQLQAWHGLAKTDWVDPAEKNIRVDALPAAVLERLKKQAIRIVTAFGTTAGKDLIESTARSLGLENARVDFGADLPTGAFGAIDKSLRDFLTSVGTDLLRQHGDPRADINALGSGGKTGLVVGMFNAPACLPAAMRCSGRVGGEVWRPLVLRRGYQQGLMFS